MPSTASVTEFRDLAEAVDAAAVAELEGLWAGWPWDDALAVRDAASLVVPDVVWAYQGVAGGIAADQYDEWRDEARVRGRFVASPAALAAEDQILAGLRFALGSLFGADPDVAAARTLLSGVVARHVGHGAADTIVDSVHADPEARGWRRVTRPSACRFCRVLAGRGGVYRSERTARFASHGNCHCTAAPSWDPDAPEVPAVAYVASQREKSDTDRARIAKVLASMD